MNKIFLRIVLALLPVLVLAGQVRAATAQQGGEFEVSPFVGYYWFDNDTGYKDHNAWGVRFGSMLGDNLEAEVSAIAVGTRLEGSERDADLRQFQADAVYNFTGLGKLVPYAAVGVGVAHYSPGSDHTAGRDSDQAFLIDYGVGARYFFTDKMAARVDLRHPIVLDNAESNYMATVGLSFFFGGGKPPVKEAEPAPAPEPVKVVAPPPAPAKEAAPAPVVEVAPAPPADSDNDGVIDSADRCPGTPAGVKVDAQGCPLDSDADGVADYLDKCPNTPAGVKVDTKGCPLDSDGDGVPDYLDKCPDTTAGAPVDATGCLKDSDHDGLTDYEEKMYGTDPFNPDSDADGLKDGEEVHRYHTDPLKPDTDGGSVNDGVEVLTNHTNPLDPSDDVKKEIKRIELKVYFDTDSDVVKPQYYPEIAQVATFLKENQGVSGTVEGHTDSRGSVAHNKNLSERRAKNVIKVAEEHFGVEKGRLTGSGFGGTRPVADNATAEGRAKNRRIEAAFTNN